jgi:rfaE bifunctional protein nucleotidyltransferase chain/domain
LTEQIFSAPIFYFRNGEALEKLLEWRKELKQRGETLVFTNGVFDLLHAGHVSYLSAARSLGSALMIGLNADSSVVRLKGPKRPIQNEQDRAAILSALKVTSAVAVFDQDTPLDLITQVIPDVLVKGGDWAVEKIVGREVVEAHGGKVLPLPFVEGRSTTGIVEMVLDRYNK